MEGTSLKRIIFYLFTFALLVFLIVFLFTVAKINSDVRDQCQYSQEKYGGDCVDALINVLNDEDNNFETRNSAIWALGQLGDKRALPELEKYYTGDIPSEESLSQVISQYELQKAIKLAGGSLNITAPFWR
jgi:HEAT repeat protein